MKKVHLLFLVLTLLCVGCGGDQFGSSASAAADAGPDSPTAVQPQQPDAESFGGSAGAVGVHHSSGGSAGASIAQGGFAGSAAFDAGSGGTSSGGAGGVPAGGASADSGHDTCKTGAMRCSDSQPEVCANGEWFSSGSACSGSTPVCLEGRCVECSPGEERCMDSTQPGKCDATGTMVANGAACTGTTPQCLDNTCVACDGSNVKTAGYCPDCGGLECCKTSTATPGAIGSCGCQTFNGCE